MQPPSNRQPFLLTRPINELINRVTQKHARLTSLKLSPQQRQEIDLWTEIQFVSSTLRLEGLELPASRISIAIEAADNGPAATAKPDTIIGEVLRGFRAIRDLARSEGQAAVLTPEVLSMLAGAAGLRSSAGQARGPFPPPAPAHLTASLESACLWFTADSFAELNPVEQASIVHLRLIEMQPFEETNERTGILAASIFTLRNSLPPIVIEPEIGEAYRRAIRESTRGNTQPMVECMASAIDLSLGKIIALVS